MYYPDLGTETEIATGPFVRAVGWLSAAHSYSMGTVSAEFIAKLHAVAARYQEAVRALKWWTPLGPHTCEFCGSFRAGGNIGIPGGDVLFVAPEMIGHYVEKHGYSPPAQFVEAVLTSPLPGTQEYSLAVKDFIYKR